MYSPNRFKNLYAHAVAERDFYKSNSQIPGWRGYENFGNRVKTLYLIFHDAQSQVKTRH
jgi:hypothetical protein